MAFNSAQHTARLGYYPFEVLRASAYGDGTPIIAKILHFALEPVDVIVTKPPQDRGKHVYSWQIGPPQQWLLQDGYTLQGSGPWPACYVTRIEAKLRTVCKNWAAITEHPDFDLMAAPAKVVRIAASTLLSRPAMYGSMFSHPRYPNERYSSLQVTFDMPTDDALYHTPAIGSKVPLHFLKVDFRFLPCAGQRDYYFSVRTFFAARSIANQMRLAFTFPYLSSISTLGSTVSLDQVTCGGGYFSFAPGTLSITADSWSPSAYSTLPSFISDLITTFSNPTGAPISQANVNTILVNLPRSLDTHTALLHAWKYAHSMKRQYPTLLCCENFTLCNNTKESQDYLFFLANFVPTFVTKFIMTPLGSRPKWHGGWGREEGGWQHKKWLIKEEAHNMDLDAFDRDHWQRTGLGHRLTGVGTLLRTEPYRFNSASSSANSSTIPVRSRGLSWNDRVQPNGSRDMKPLPAKSTTNRRRSRAAAATLTRSTNDAIDPFEAQVQAYLAALQTAPAPPGYRAVILPPSDPRVAEEARIRAQVSTRNRPGSTAMSDAVSEALLKQRLQLDCTTINAIDSMRFGADGRPTPIMTSHNAATINTPHYVREDSAHPTSSPNLLTQLGEDEEENAMDIDTPHSDLAYHPHTFTANDDQVDAIVPATRTLFNAYPGERQSFTNLTGLIIGVQGAWDLRTPERDTVSRIHERWMAAERSVDAAGGPATSEQSRGGPATSEQSRGAIKVRYVVDGARGVRSRALRDMFFV